MIEFFDAATTDEDEETVRPGPLWRHALWAAGIAVLGVGLGRVTGLFRIGPEDYGLPSAAPGPLWPYLAAWTVIGFLTAAVLRATAARVPVYAPGRIGCFLTLLGTRLSLGWRPEAPVLAALGAAALAAAAVWCALALRPGPRGTDGGDASAT
ncbi:hypothetical protein ACE1OA_03455 [Streptomyces sp. JL2001]|uniref:hypothetical protein n=1 Tax=Streptomyces sp. JL2001 TaxID=3342488 RepID=UPI003D8058C2